MTKLFLFLALTAAAQTTQPPQLITVTPGKPATAAVPATVVIAPSATLTCTLTQHPPTADVSCTVGANTFTLPSVPVTGSGFIMSLNLSGTQLSFSLSPGQQQGSIAWAATAIVPNAAPQTASGNF